MERRLSARQLRAVFFVGLLSPAAAVAGVDWRGGVFAVPVVIAVTYSWRFLGREAGGWMKSWGKGARSALSIVYIMYLAAAAGAALASAGVRIAAPDGEGAGWIAVLLWVPAVILARRKITVLGRTAEIFWLMMSVMFVVVLVFGGIQVKSERLFSREGNVGESALTAAGVCCMGVAVFLLWEGGDAGEKPKWGAWNGAAVALISLMRVVTIGTLGGVLAGEKERAFFGMTVGLGETARVEGVVSAVWLLADITFAGLCCACGAKLWGVLVGEGRAGDGVYPFALTVLGTGIWMETYGKASLMQERMLPAVGVFLGGGVPIFACLTEKMKSKKGLKRKREKGGEK